MIAVQLLSTGNIQLSGTPNAQVPQVAGCLGTSEGATADTIFLTETGRRGNTHAGVLPCDECPSQLCPAAHTINTQNTYVLSYLCVSQVHTQVMDLLSINSNHCQSQAAQKRLELRLLGVER